MIAKRPAGAEPYAQVHESVRARVALEQLDRARAAWLREARLKAKIVVVDPWLQARVHDLMAADVPFEPSNLTPQIPLLPR